MSNEPDDAEMQLLFKISTFVEAGYSRAAIISVMEMDGYDGAYICDLVDRVISGAWVIRSDPFCGSNS